MNATHKTASEAWQIYRDRGQISNQLLRPHVYRAWERAHRERMSPLHVKAETLSPLSTERLLEKKYDLIKAARPYLQALSAAAGQERHAAMLGDESAVVIDVIADAATLEGPNSFPGAGSILHESVSGANGIGTPLVENGYAEIVGSEHFIQGFHSYSCQGVPIRGPDNEIVGILSTSVRRLEASQRLREIMLVAAKGISAELMIRHLERMMHEVVKHGELSSCMVEKLRQDLIQVYAAGRMKVEIVAMQLGRSTHTSPFEDGSQLLAAAGTAMERFRDQSTLCLNLASSEAGARTLVDLGDVIGKIQDLLVTEARIKKVKILNPDIKDVLIYSDQRLLEKQLLRLFLEALNAAEGHCLRIEIRSCSLDRKSKEVTIIPVWESVQNSRNDRFFSVLRLDENGTIRMQTNQQAV